MLSLSVKTDTESCSTYRRPTSPSPLSLLPRSCRSPQTASLLPGSRTGGLFEGPTPPHAARTTMGPDLGDIHTNRYCCVNLFGILLPGALIDLLLSLCSSRRVNTRLRSLAMRDYSSYLCCHGYLCCHARGVSSTPLPGCCPSPGGTGPDHFVGTPPPAAGGVNRF